VKNYEKKTKNPQLQASLLVGAVLLLEILRVQMKTTKERERERERIITKTKLF